MSAPVLGEFVGTMILILLGGGVVAAVSLERSKAKGAGWLVVTTAWALAVMCGVFVSKALGGPGSLNPVGQLAAIVQGKEPVDAQLKLIAAQFLGAFSGSVLVWLHYLPHWKATSDPATKLGIFCTTPAIRNPPANLLSEAIGTFALVFVASAIGQAKIGSLEPAFVGMVVWAVGLSLGATTGYAINPARDLGPRIAHAVLPIAGKGPSDWGYAWVPVVGPCVGGVLGALLFRALAG
jgi:glycerol uptake facilitator protein